MADVFTRVQREIQERLEQVEAELTTVGRLRAEKARIEHALAAEPFATTAPAAPTHKAAPASRTSRAKPRAPRGANRAAVHAALEMMPGASLGEIVSAAKLERAQVSALLRDGVDKGEIKAVELAAGQIGYQIIRPVETAFPSPTPASSPAADSAPITSASATSAAVPDRGRSRVGEEGSPAAG